MASERAELAAARARSARRRSEQLRERIERLSAGSASSEADVLAARAAAADQRMEALRARDRLAVAHVLAGEVGRRRADLGRTTLAVPDRAGPPAPAGASLLRRERRFLRSALLSVVASRAETGQIGVEPVRQALWETMLDRCVEVTWKGWVSALCVAAVDLLPDLRGAAVSGHDRRGVPYLLGASDDWSRRAEEVERVVGEGPASQAYRSGTPVEATLVADGQSQWPGYTTAAALAGIERVSARPAQLNGVSLASLTLFWHASGDGAADGGQVPALLAALTSQVLQLDLAAMEDGLELGDEGSDHISIATGMLAEQLEVGVDEALDRMRAHAFGEALGLSDVAEAIVEGSLRLR